MRVISELSDDLLVKILSYLPTKVAASTMILSRQWQFLWMWLPNLEFDVTRATISDFKSDLERLRHFLLRNLPLHRAPVIECFRLNLICSDINPEDVRAWAQFAVSRDVRELDISYSSDYEDEDNILPSSLYTCKSLVTLKLYGIIFMDVPRMVCLPSLKTLQLKTMIYNNKYSLPWLLYNCPVLEDLSVNGNPPFGNMIVIVPSLQRLSLQIFDDLDEFVIDTPSLEYLELDYDDCDDMYISIKNMPKLKEAFVEVKFSLFDKLIGSIPSVERLTLCLSFNNMSEVVFDDGFVFNKLKYLKLCTCRNYSLNVLVKLLKVSPKLRVLKLFTKKSPFHRRTCMDYWNQPSTIPECILTSLEKFKWSGYKGSKEERELVIYILQNAPRLKTATILLYEDLDKPLDIKKEFDMKKELELSYRASITCQLLFR